MKGHTGDSWVSPFDTSSVLDRMRRALAELRGEEVGSLSAASKGEGEEAKAEDPEGTK